jgi:plastocyanin
VAAAAVFALGLSGASLAGIGHTTAATAGDLRLSARDTAFSPDHLLAPAGLVTIRLTNHDLFWHTFTVRGLGADSKVPVGGTRRVTFRAQRGTYQFVCRIPGHKQAGMQGTLIVQ